MPQDSLQREDLAALHHVVAGEGVPQDVGQLAGCVQAGALVGFAERRSTGAEQPTRSWVATLKHQVHQIIRHGDGPHAAILRHGEANLSVQQLVSGDRLRFIPSSTGSQTELGDGQGVAVGRRGAFIQHQSAFVQGEIGQLGFIDPQLPQLGDRVGLMPDAQADQLVEHDFEITVFMVHRCRGAALEAFGPVAAFGLLTGSE